MRAALAFALAAVLGLLVGCGNATGPATTTAAESVRVGSDRYLADAAEAADAIRAFAAALAQLPSPATPARLKAIVPALDPPLGRARLATQRLAAERLADSRLDEQRAQGATALAGVIAAMLRLRDAAAAGDPPATKSAAQALETAITGLRGPLD